MANQHSPITPKSPSQRDRTKTDVRYSVSSLFGAVSAQDATKGDLLATNQKALYELKREISMMSKSNYTWEQDISSLDKKIALLIQHRITLEEVMNHTGDINSLHQARTTTLKNKKDIEHYGQLFLLLQRETIYIATLARLVTVGEIDNLLQTVILHCMVTSTTTKRSISCFPCSRGS